MAVPQKSIPLSLDLSYHAELREMFSIYKDIYDLPEYLHEDKNVLKDPFDYAKQRKYFVILILHTKEGYVCFQRAFDQGHLMMNLPGGSLRLERNDTIISAIERVAVRNFKDAKIADIAPVIYLTNRFYDINNETFEHYGLAVRALLLNPIGDIKNVSRKFLYKGRFLPDYPAKEIPHPPAKEALAAFYSWFKSINYSPNTREIETQHKVIKRYVFHQRVVNPSIKFFSRKIGKYSIYSVKQRIRDMVGANNKVLDVACGDDKNIFKILANSKLLVANDICVSQIENMKRLYDRTFSKSHQKNTLIFTNHDCLDLPFGNKQFDVAICSNLMHHLDEQEELPTLFSNLRRVANKVLVVEIQDPAFEGLWGRLRHQYYLKVLRDEARKFYSSDGFRDVICAHFADCEKTFEYYETIRGMYMFAEIICPNCGSTNN